MIFRRRRDPKQQLIEDIIRAAGFMEAIQLMARRLDAPDTVDAAAALLVWRVWLAKVRGWADQDR